MKSVNWTPERLAVHVVFNGRVYARRVTYEGTPESGPYALEYRGFRLGQLKVELSPRGDLALVGRTRWHRTPWGLLPVCQVHILRHPELKERIREEPLPKTTSS